MILKENMNNTKLPRHRDKSVKKNKVSKKTKQKNLVMFAIVASTIALIYFITIIKLSQVGVQI